MFFEVRIFDSDGELKRVVSPKKLSRNFWKKSDNNQWDFNDLDFSSDEPAPGRAMDKIQVRMDDTSL